MFLSLTHIKQRGAHIIYLSENLDEHLARFVIAHELGHMQMHRSMNTVFMDAKTYNPHSKFERQANTFAVELLLPDDLLREHPECTIRQLARSFSMGLKQKKRQQPTVEIGEIAAVLIDGDATLKHFYRDGDSVTLVSSNTKYKPMAYHKGDCDEFRILGKAIAYLHDLE